MAEERNINQKDVQDVMSTLESSLQEMGDEQNADLTSSIMVLLQAPDD